MDSFKCQCSGFIQTKLSQFVTNGRLKIARHELFHKYNNYILVNIIGRWLAGYLKYIALMIDCLQPVHEVH